MASIRPAVAGDGGTTRRPARLGFVLEERKNKGMGLGFQAAAVEGFIRRREAVARISKRGGDRRQGSGHRAASRPEVEDKGGFSENPLGYLEIAGSS